jgi:hypothetical protein
LRRKCTRQRCQVDFSTFATNLRREHGGFGDDLFAVGGGATAAGEDARSVARVGCEGRADAGSMPAR